MYSAYKLPLLFARSGEGLGQDQRHRTSIGAWWWSCQRREGPRSAPQTGFSARFRAAQLRGSSDAVEWRDVFLKAGTGCGVGILISWCLHVRAPRVSPYLQPQDLSPSAPKPPSELQAGTPAMCCPPTPLQMTSNFSQSDSLF